jgi:hypothetical protein
MHAFIPPSQSKEHANSLGHHLRLLKAKTERINVLEQNQSKQQQASCPTSLSTLSDLSRRLIYAFPAEMAERW